MVNANVYAQAIAVSKDVARQWRARTRGGEVKAPRQTVQAQNETIARLAALFPESVEVH